MKLQGAGAYGYNFNRFINVPPVLPKTSIYV